MNGAVPPICFSRESICAVLPARFWIVDIWGLVSGHGDLLLASRRGKGAIFQIRDDGYAIVAEERKAGPCTPPSKWPCRGKTQRS